MRTLEDCHCISWWSCDICGRGKKIESIFNHMQVFILNKLQFETLTLATEVDLFDNFK